MNKYLHTVTSVGFLFTAIKLLQNSNLRHMLINIMKYYITDINVNTTLHPSVMFKRESFRFYYFFITWFKSERIKGVMPY